MRSAVELDRAVVLTPPGIAPPGALCGHCAHWRRNPTDPMNLGAPPQGECREQLHVVSVPMPQGVGLQALYPTLPANFNACDRFKRRAAGE